MDNQNLLNNNIPDGGLFRKPEMPLTPAPLSNPDPFSRILTWLKSHRKLSIIVLILLLVTGIWLLFGNTLKNRFFPNSGVSLPFTNPPAQNQFSSMKIQTPKASFAMSEKIPVSVIASSNNAVISGFDTLIEYDPQFLALSQRNTPPLNDYSYFGKNTDKLISVSAVLKEDSKPASKFDNTTLFELEFTPKRPGKTVLKIVYIPNSTSDSNLLDNQSKDVLGSAAGAEINIQ